MNRRKFLKSIPLLGVLPLVDFDSKESFSIDENKVLERVKSFNIQICGEPIENHRAIRKIQPCFDRELLRIRVAESWRISPNELDNIDIDTQLDMYASYIANRQIDAITKYNTRFV